MKNSLEDNRWCDFFEYTLVEVQKARRIFHAYQKEEKK